MRFCVAEVIFGGVACGEEVGDSVDRVAVCVDGCVDEVLDSRRCVDIVFNSGLNRVRSVNVGRVVVRRSGRSAVRACCFDAHPHPPPNHARTSCILWWSVALLASFGSFRDGWDDNVRGTHESLGPFCHNSSVVAGAHDLDLAAAEKAHASTPDAGFDDEGTVAWILSAGRVDEGRHAFARVLSLTDGGHRLFKDRNVHGETGVGNRSVLPSSCLDFHIFCLWDGYVSVSERVDGLREAGGDRRGGVARRCLGSVCSAEHLERPTREDLENVLTSMCMNCGFDEVDCLLFSLPRGHVLDVRPPHHGRRHLAEINGLKSRIILALESRTSHGEIAGKGLVDGLWRILGLLIRNRRIEEDTVRNTKGTKCTPERRPREP
mmetsp:Transcript_36593/g.79088  ORF Transcript_36593/g.79088 Transcript_36593/m.79088 type:complete len:377 (+) Transcript_36593:95-1225(+)